MNPVSYKTPVVMARLWMHETRRVYADRMVNQTDVDKFEEILSKNAKTHLGEMPAEELNEEPNLFASFVTDDDAKFYLPFTKGWTQLSDILEAKLAEYNESYAQMNLVLFNAAMEHIVRISRIIGSPRGNAMLVGVGGSGKQSLTRFAAYTAEMSCFQIELTKGYGYNEFREDLKKLYFMTGCDNTPVVFLFADTQVTPYPLP